MRIQIVATGSKGNAYIAGDGTTQVMIECGLPFSVLQKKTGFGVTKNSCCLISHEHIDHVRGAEGVSKYIPIACPKETLEEIMFKQNLTYTHPIKTGVPTAFGSLWVTAFPAKHNAVNPVGYYIKSLLTKESLVFITDSMYSKFTFPDADYAMIECNYDEAILQSNQSAGLIDEFLAKRIRLNHMSLSTAKDIVKRLSSLKELYLIHQSSGNLDFNEAVRSIREVYDGKIITIRGEFHEGDLNDR